MARQATAKHRGPGLFYTLAVLVVVAVAAARFFGFSPAGPKGETPPLDHGLHDAAPIDPAGPLPSAMTQVLVYHTHTTENYHPNPSHADRGPGDIVNVGKALVTALGELGVGAVHVETVHDLPKWDQSSDKARQSVESVLARHDGIRVVIDLHRDALPQGTGAAETTTSAGGERAAKMLLVVGASGNPLVQANAAFANQLKERLDQVAPGVARGVRVLPQPTHGDLHERSVTVFVGDYSTNTLDEAIISAKYLAQAIALLLREDG